MIIDTNTLILAPERHVEIEIHYHVENYYVTINQKDDSVLNEIRITPKDLIVMGKSLINLGKMIEEAKKNDN